MCLTKRRMSRVLVSVFITMGWFAPEVSAQKLSPFEELPSVEKGWKLREQGKVGDFSFQWHWLILTNAVTADVLSFVSHKLILGEKRQFKKPRGKWDFIYFSDIVQEIFLGGYLLWTVSSSECFTSYPIRNVIVKLDSIDSIAKKSLFHEALQYIFVEEQELGTNRMAHGYVLIFDEVSVFVQHASTKPSTNDFVYRTARALTSIHYKQKSVVRSEQLSVQQKIHKK